MSECQDRSRMTYAAAVAVINDPRRSVVCHLVDNEDGTYSVMSHIVCHWCNLCELQGDCRGVEAPVAMKYQEEFGEDSC